MELPHPWELRESTRYPGRCFYFNRETKETRWIRPVPYPGRGVVWPPIIYALHILACGHDAKAKIDRIFNDLITGKRRFEDVARAESDDLETKSKGGTLGWIKHGSMPPEFERAAWQLNICEMSSPVSTPQGWHLILRRG